MLNPDYSKFPPELDARRYADLVRAIQKAAEDHGYEVELNLGAQYSWDRTIKVEALFRQGLPPVSEFAVTQEPRHA